MKRTSLNEHIHSILYLEGTTGYTIVYFTDRKPQLYPYPLIRFAEAMPTLLRTHRTYLINPDHIEAFYDQGPVHVTISERKLPVSRRRVKAIYLALHSFSALAATKQLDCVPTTSQGAGKQVRLPVNIFDVEVEY